MWVPVLVTVILIGLDQLLKAWARSALTLGAPQVVAIPGVLEWILTFNTGAAWNLFSSSTVPLALGRLLVGLGILVYMIRRPQGRLVTLALSLIAAGAIGNAVDDLRSGRVTDMIHAPPLSPLTRLIGQGDFPIFNLADSCVVVGTAGLILVSIFGERPSRH